MATDFKGYEEYSIIEENREDDSEILYRELAMIDRTWNGFSSADAALLADAWEALIAPA